MESIDRNSIADARNHISKLFSEHTKGNELALFMARQLKIAHKENPNNWNLNLDLKGRFLRFNVGQCYCIQVCKNEVLVLCLKNKLPKQCKQSNVDFYFRGHINGSDIIDTTNFNETPQCLTKVPDSVGLVFNNITRWIPEISKSNEGFIKYAINNTHILPQMLEAHSAGAVEYLSEITGNALHNPSFADIAISKNETKLLKRLKKLSDRKLEQLATSQSSHPKKIKMSKYVYIRNPYIVEQAKRIAKGVCQDCGNAAPFFTQGTNEPFLEVHHIKPLSQGGEDTIENVIALCPNCHKKKALWINSIAYRPTRTDKNSMFFPCPYIAVYSISTSLK